VQSEDEIDDLMNTFQYCSNENVLSKGKYFDCHDMTDEFSMLGEMCQEDEF
jgi:hypothetical protein